MKRIMFFFCICLVFSGCLGFPSGKSSSSSNQAPQQTTTYQKQPVMLEGEALANWCTSTLKKYSEFPEKSKYPVYTLPTVKMAVSNWSNRESRYARVKLSGTVKSFKKGSGLVALEFTSGGPT